MSIFEWDFYTQGTGTWSLISGVGVAIEGNSSIQFDVPDTQTGGGNTITKTIGGLLPKAVTAGRFRTLYQLNENTHPQESWGIVAMQSNEDLTTGTSDFYYLRVNINGQWRLERIESGDVSSAGTLIQFGTCQWPGLGRIGSMELLWYLSPPDFGGVRFNAKFGLKKDYSDLDDNSSGFFDDTVGYLTTTVGEGLVAENFGSNREFAVGFDKEELYIPAIIP